MKKNRYSRHWGLLFLLTFVVFIALLLNAAITAAVVYLLIHRGILSVSGQVSADHGRLLWYTSLLSIPLGLIVSLSVSKIPLRPVRNLIESMDRLSSGDFKTRVNVGTVMRRYPPFVELAESFNKMAEQLENTEMLRSDFINNLSHEFKTPIVSIAGLSKLLRRENLPPEQQKEYLAAIEEESMRLSNMATNVLNLTKVENQTILNDLTVFNLSEQIRSCILLLENRWTQKELELQLEFGEHTIRADEELVKQVWINLLDNAIKFTPRGHTVRVRIEESDDVLSVSILNTGSQISPEDQEKIWNKFYQADQSHATQGNGVGLAIVKRIVALHRGRVQVSSGDDVTVFTVELPKNIP